MTTNFFVKRTVFLLCAMILLDMSCASDESGEKKTCDDSDLAITANESDPATCSSTDGEIELVATGGKAPYTYSFNNGAFDDELTFDGLSAGAYTVKVKDANGCEREMEVTLSTPGSTVEVDIVSSEDAGCKTTEGSIDAEATGGTEPYTYKLNAGAFGDAHEFSNLAAGTYTITAKDADGCITTSPATKVTSGVRWNDHIKPLLENRCVHCHGPSGVWAGTDREWDDYDNVKKFAAAIKTKTGNGSMPKDLAASGGLPQDERDMIACWVDDGALEN